MSKMLIYLLTGVSGSLSLSQAFEIESQKRKPQSVRKGMCFEFPLEKEQTKHQRHFTIILNTKELLDVQEYNLHPSYQYKFLLYV